MHHSTLTLALLCSACTMAHPGADDAARPRERDGGAGPEADAARPDAGADVARFDAGVVPGADASPAARPDAGPLGETTAPPRGTGVTCGRLTCEADVSYCRACRHSGPAGIVDVECLSRSPGARPFDDAFEHGCGFPIVYAECDGPEDCPTDEVCSFSGGEFGYARCLATDDRYPFACHDDSDCDPGVRCGEVDPLGYFSPLAEGLGWRPYICGGASAEASTFCDRYEVSCGYPQPEGFYTRQDCLTAHDGLTPAAQTCATSHLDHADGTGSHCAHAAAPDPCAP